MNYYYCCCCCCCYYYYYYYYYYYIRLTPFSRTTWVIRQKKRKPSWIILEQEMMGVAVASAGPLCKSLAAHSRQITMPLAHHSVLQARCPSCRPTDSVNALKAQGGG